MMFLSIVRQIIGGFGTTLLLFFFTLLFSLPLGILFAVARMSKFKPLQMFMQVFISILRGTPLMLQLIVVFFMPFYVFGMKLSTGWRLYAALIGFSINMETLCSPDRFFHQLCGIFRRDLQGGHPGSPHGTKGSGRSAGIHPDADLLEDHFPADGQARHSPCHQ